MMLPSNLLLTHFHEQLSLLRHCPPPLPTLLNHSEDKNGNECLRQNSCYKSNLLWTISLYSSTKIVRLDLENEKKSQELDSMNLMGPFQFGIFCDSMMSIWNYKHASKFGKCTWKMRFKNEKKIMVGYLKCSLTHKNFFFFSNSKKKKFRHFLAIVMLWERLITEG